MITSPVFAGKRYAVLGLARSGLATVDALVASGAEVVAWDEKEEAREKLLPGTGRGTAARSAVVEGGLSPAPPPLHHASHGSPPRPGEDLVLADPLETDLTGFDGVVVSPGVPLNRHPIVGHAAKFGVPVIGDIELFALARPSLPPHKVVGITGTNGKSTTTALVHHILKTAGVPTTMGGNIGLPILAQDPLPEGGVYVLELSSYQIDLTHSLDCDVAVLLNITPDHLDRYDNFEAYSASKMRLFQMQSAGNVAVVAQDTELTRNLATQLGDRVYDVSGSWPLQKGVSVHAGRLEIDEAEIDLQSKWPSLAGPHNAQNVSAAVAVSLALGVQLDVAVKALRSYAGLPHRMERIAERNGVLFVNDSKATNPDSAAPALAAYPQVHWIVGGKAKTDDLGPCVAYLGHVRAAYAIGEAGPMFFELLHDKVPMVEHSVTLDAAVKCAARFAKPGEVVLLSPACASFDQFRDFEARGEAFRKAVEALA